MTDNRIALSLESVNTLVRRARTGDDMARNEICAQVQEYLRMMAIQQVDGGLRKKMNPSDLVQLTMCRMVNGIEEFHGSTDAEFYGWLNQILRNEINTSRRDLHRQKRDISRERDLDFGSQHQRRAEFADPNLTPSSEAIQHEKLAQFHKTLEKLPADYAEVIELRSLQELPFKQVAEIMGKSYDATTKLWYRAVVKFQELLDES